MLAASFALLIVVAALMFLLGISKYKTIINPLSSYVCMHIMGFTFLSSFISLQEVEAYEGSSSALAMVNFCAIGVALAFGSAFITQRPICLKLYARALNCACPQSHYRLARYNTTSIATLVLLLLVCFVAMAILGGGGVLWLTDPRSAYLSNRNGVGILYATIQTLISLVLLMYLLSGCSKSDWQIVLACSFAGFLAYFTGSKNNILAIIIIGFVYRHFFTRRIPALVVFVFAICCIHIFIGLLILQGSYDGALSALSYFQDYSKTTAMFFSEVWPEKQFAWGAITLESLWYYVPRSIWPDKPYEYGILRIHESLFPGMAAQGHTPGIHLWTSFFWDLGPLGLAVYGFSHGWLGRSAFEFFLIHRENRIAFITMLQLSLWPIFSFATLPILLMTIFFVYCCDRISLLKKGHFLDLGK